MSDNQDWSENIDVAIIGGGPSGLSAAIELKRRNIAAVVVLDREPEVGGIPRHCGHYAFGMREFTRVLTGPQYARKLAATARDAGVNIQTLTTVIEARAGGELLIATDEGVKTIKPRRIIYATGARETPRSARLISGNRPQGVVNTGALQSMIYLKDRKPFERPVIIGTELVSFSAIMTCQHAKIRPVAMFEESAREIARWPSSFFPRLMGIPLEFNTKLVEIEGERTVTGVVVEKANGEKCQIECDGVILTGRFTPEASLASCGHLAVDPRSRGPIVDQYGRCSDPVYFATGNILRPIETAGWSWNEGRMCGQWVADDLMGKLPAPTHELQIVANGPLLKLAMPQKISLPIASAGLNMGMKNLQLRFSRAAKGQLEASNDKGVFWKRQMSVLPERRILVPIEELIQNADGGKIELEFKELR